MAAHKIRPEFLESIAKRQKEREASFARIKSSCVLDSKAKRIVDLSFFKLVENLQSRQLTATEVLNAYTAKALEVTERVNCVTEFNPNAEKYATNLDKIAKIQNVKLGPLHGIPFAVKDDQDVEGMDTTMGFAHNLNKPAKESSVVVQVLVNLGAIPFCKANLAQSVLSFAGDNPIYGIVKNGVREDMASGGSSSGSASIVAAGGAPFALGSDLGGSLRVPSHYHGVATLRGTTNRLSGKGMLEGIPIVTQRGVPGIIAPDAQTLSFLWKCLTQDKNQNQLDPMAVPIPWNELLFSSRSPLRIGYFSSLPFYPTFPDTQNTILAARDALLKAGHKVVPFEMLDSFDYVQVIYDHLISDQGTWITNRFEGEPLAVCMKDFVTMLRDPKLRAELQSKARSQRERMMLDGVGKESGSSAEKMKNIYQQRIHKLEVLKRMEKTGVDLILAPVLPHPAVKQEFPLFPHQTMGAYVYTMIWNFLNLPAGVVKFGMESEESVAMEYDDEGDPILKEAKESLVNSVGMPINVQIIGQPFKEELVLRALTEIEKLRNC